MKVSLSTLGKFHTFDLARELHSRKALACIFTAYPRFKLINEHLPPHLIRTFPWLHAPYVAFDFGVILGKKASSHWEYLDRVVFDRYVSSNLPDCDVFVGLSSSALLSGKAARTRGAKYVCDRGSCHIRTQDRLLREEHELWGIRFAGIDPRIIELEESEYAEADHITVPSTFNVQSFIEHGVAAAKISKLSYGVDLTRFHPTGEPIKDQFDVLFVGGMSLRKGLPYLLKAFQQVDHPKKSLTMVGSADRSLVRQMRARGLWSKGISMVGHVPQAQLKEFMSRSHVMVLPSIEEGLAMVQAQALACGCPVIATENTGARDLYEDGHEGFIVQIRAADQIAQCLQQFADSPALRSKMSAAATVRVKLLGGWSAYGCKVFDLYSSLTESPYADCSPITRQ